MYTFKDAYNNQVFLSFERHPFSKNPRHVWVVCTYDGKWLLTKHSKRGMEFPGGKLEIGETPEQAAVREVFEETGGKVDTLTYIGQYKVVSKGAPIIKNIYVGKVKELVEQQDYFETKGPVLLDEIPPSIQREEGFSFIMKDNVLQYVMKYIKRIKAI
ncbi:RNA deprotection pyrophosphohydrolase [Metabacillus iocasae]|uniref:8-oxo-dGTP diphosphatase n=1 Tax=Priestia iocasae TaxID=2291674 RepID=A0ABS2QZC1_9BACI|nr:nucleoside triphosphatase YtkD [Metabacillus iocasae]MBM7704835.1 8-oxo-dGTP diphosphatase [Metabacillus iocasae]